MTKLFWQLLAFNSLYLNLCQAFPFCWFFAPVLVLGQAALFLVAQQPQSVKELS